MATILEARAVISGEDRSGPAFASVERKMAALGKSAAAVNKVSAAMSSLSNVVASRKMIDGMSNFDDRMASQRMIEGLSSVGRTVDQVSTKFSALSRTMAGARQAWKQAAPWIEGAVGLGAIRATEKALKAGATLESERVHMRVAGIPQPEIAASEQQAFDLAGRYPNIAPSEAMQTYKETRSVLLKPDETPGMMPTVIAAKAAMKALGMGQEEAQGLYFGIKGAEVLGRAQSPERFKGYLDAFIRAREVMGQTITPETMYHFAQQVKASGVSLSDRFLNTVGVSLSQEMGGGQAGKSIDQFVKQIVGGFQGSQHSAAKEFVHFGLANKHDFLTTKTGEIKGLKPGRHIHDWKLAETDPDKYVYQDVLPALAKNGITSLNDQIAEIRRMFPNTMAANLVAKLTQQRPSYEQHAKLYGQAEGLQGGLDLLEHDPTAALASLTTAFQSFGAALTSPIMANAATAMSAIAKSVASWSSQIENFEKAHPDLSKYLSGGAVVGGAGIGVAGIFGFIKGMSGGFGLSTAAGALDASAASLDAAAAKLGAPAGVTKAAATGASAGAGGALVATMSTGVTAAMAGGVVGLDVIKHDAAHGNDLRTWLRGALGIEDPHEPAPWLPGGSWHKSAGGPDGGHIGGDVAASLSAIADRPVKVDGQAEVTAKGEITLTAEAQRFFSLVQQLSVVASGILKAGGGSTGTSMPEAQPLRKGYQK
jgi:hypothetical protein